MSTEEAKKLMETAEKEEKKEEKKEEEEEDDDFKKSEYDPEGPTLLQPNQPLTDMPSFCFSCGSEGRTRMLYTMIPYFREIVVMSFKCKECGFESTETKAAAEIQVKGVRYELELTNDRDLNRQIVKGNTATITVPALQLELPPEAQKGSLNTIEGLFQQTGEHLSLSLQNNPPPPEQLLKMGEFMANMARYERGDEDVFPFTLIVDDPSGNSFVENPHMPKADPHLKITHYTRTAAQNNAVGLMDDHDERLEAEKLAEQEKSASSSSSSSAPAPKKEKKEGTVAVSDEMMEKTWDPKGEVMLLPTECSACEEPGDLRMLVTRIPYFREVILMSFSCPHCGHKSNEVKATGEIPDKGKRYVLRNAGLDLTRSVLKSETAEVYIPELQLELTSGTLGGKFTTIEGLLADVEQSLSANPFIRDGDSKEDSEKWEKFFADLEKMKKGEMTFTFCMEDPLAASHIQNIYAPDEDPDLGIEEYERSFEQDEELGIHDMVV